MFIGVADFVQCPEKIVPPLVRLEPAKESLNLSRQVFALSEGPTQVVNRLGKRKSGISRLRFSQLCGNGKSCRRLQHLAGNFVAGGKYDLGVSDQRRSPIVRLQWLTAVTVQLFG